MHKQCFYSGARAWSQRCATANLSNSIRPKVEVAEEDAFANFLVSEGEDLLGALDEKHYLNKIRVRELTFESIF